MPIEVVGCGVRTGNLAPPLSEWEDGYVASNTGGIAKPFPVQLEKVTELLPVPEGISNLTFSAEDGTFETGTSGAWRAVGFFDRDGAFISRPGGNGANTVTVTVPEGAAFMRACCRTYGSEKNYMLNLGSTALPYEPYGFKLDISSGGENLFDKSTILSGYEIINNQIVSNPAWGVSDYIPVEQGKYYIATNTGSPVLEYETIGGTAVRSGKSIVAGNYTPSKTTRFIRINFRLVNVDTVMLNLGSTAKPYSPYNRTTTPIYLGQVESTRRVKKLVLTGEESWFEFGAEYPSRFITYAIADRRRGIAPICTHYIGSTATNYSGLSDGYISVSTAPSSNGRPRTTIRDDRFLTVADFKSYLAAQYAAGTPVTVWYVLAEPETGIVNEPLMKIGDYADTVSAAQAGVTIPTVSGENVLDMASPVKPSEVYIKGKGIKPTGYGQLVDANRVNILDKDGRPVYVHGQ